MPALDRKLLAAILAIFLTACGAGHTIVSTPPPPSVKVATVALAYDQSTVPVPEKDLAKMKELLEQRFFNDKQSKFKPGNELTIKWGFIGFDKGSQFTRWFLGFGAGEAKMVVRADFYDEKGAKIASIQADGTISGGFFGGSSDDAFKAVANQIATFAESNFR